MKLLNKTDVKQQILFIDGTAIDVSPGGTADINPNLLYKEELERVCFLFSLVEKVEEKKPENKIPSSRLKRKNMNEKEDEEINDENMNDGGEE